MNNAPAFLSTLSLSAIVNTTIMEPKYCIQALIKAVSPETACGKKTARYIEKEGFTGDREISRDQI